MAGSGLLALLDDITTLLDDIAVMSKTAAVKTAGVTGDDLAVGAQGMVGLNASREIPVVKKVFYGSLRNKAILIPSTLAISALGTVTGLNLIAPLLVLGGGYLCFEGFEKAMHMIEKEVHKFTGTKDKKEEMHHEKMLDAAVHGNLERFEKDKIKGAVKTDFVLSAEIMILTLGVVSAAPLAAQLGTLTAIGLGMSVFVYGLVGCIVKMDDAGLWMTQREGASLAKKAVRGMGHGLVNAAPYLMGGLSVIGTVAMFSVGGHILAETIPALAALAHGFHGFAATGAEILTGLVAGGVTVGAVTGGAALFQKCRKFLPHLAAKKNTTPGLSPIPAPEPETALAPARELTAAMAAVAQRTESKATAAAPSVSTQPNRELK